MIAIAIQAAFLCALVYVITPIISVGWVDDFLINTKLGQRMQLLPKPFSCSACLSGWLTIFGICFLAFHAGFFAVSFTGALIGGYVAARHINGKDVL
jgi:hypothetical protein